jgi:hypothetical protein
VDHPFECVGNWGNAAGNLFHHPDSPPKCATVSSGGILTCRVAHREPMHTHSTSGAIDTAPMPGHIPPVPEIGATSAALKSAAFFIAARCQPFSDDFMMCRKQKWNDEGPGGCLNEGRKVTRCAISVYIPGRGWLMKGLRT